MDIDITDYRYDEDSHQLFMKRTLGSTEYELPFSDESDGTKKLIAALPVILLALREGRMVIIDELDATLNLVLTHNPDDIDLLSSDEEYVVLAGGSLKGQVRIPFFGGIIKKDGYKKYTESYYNIGNIKLYNSGGIGTNNVNFRLFNKPEINLYRLEKK